MADDFIVVCIDVTELSRETGFSCVDFAVDNNSDADSPADVDENNIFFSFYTPLHIFSVSHGTGVVVNGYFMTQLFRQDIRQRAFLKIELAETISGFRIYSSRYIYIDI